ncbi:MAG: 50S ribosomal protein L25 [Candidatus Latescibacterota bacterium]|nr:MAG: 50S ribosomal protein L25 [Candidatus Latescibacterota bacterium]
MENYKLKSDYRETSGKGEARKLRSQGMIPGTIYGYRQDTLSIAVNELELRRLLTSRGESAIVDLTIEGKVSKECNAIIKEVQQHPATGRILHIDFQYLRKGEKLRLEVPVELAGTATGVKDMGGVLERGPRVLQVRCFPRHIPEKIEIDVSELKIQDAIHVEDIVDAHPKLEFLDDPATTLVIVVPPKVEVEPTPAEEEEAAEEPEVIAKGKEEEGEKAEGTEESSDS